MATMLPSIICHLPSMNIDGNHVTCFIQCHCVNLVLGNTKSLELNLPFAFIAKIILDLCEPFSFFFISLSICISVVLVQLIIQ